MEQHRKAGQNPPRVVAPTEEVEEELESNSSGHSDYYLDLNSVLLRLRIKIVKIDGSDLASAESNTVHCVNKFAVFGW